MKKADALLHLPFLCCIKTSHRVMMLSDQFFGPQEAFDIDERFLADAGQC